MDQSSSQANATSQRTINGAVIQSKLCGSFAHRKGYYFSLFSASKPHDCSFFLAFYISKLQGNQSQSFQKLVVLSHRIMVWYFCTVEKQKKKVYRKGSPACLTRRSLDETQSEKTLWGSSSLGEMIEGKIMGAWGKIKREKEGGKQGKIAGEGGERGKYYCCSAP